MSLNSNNSKAPASNSPAASKGSTSTLTSPALSTADCTPTRLPAHC